METNNNKKFQELLNKTYQQLCELENENDSKIRDLKNLNEQLAEDAENAKHQNKIMHNPKIVNSMPVLDGKITKAQNYINNKEKELINSITPKQIESKKEILEILLKYNEEKKSEIVSELQDIATFTPIKQNLPDNTILNKYDENLTQINTKIKNLNSILEQCNNLQNNKDNFSEINELFATIHDLANQFVQNAEEEYLEYKENVRASQKNSKYTKEQEKLIKLISTKKSELDGLNQEKENLTKKIELNNKTIEELPTKLENNNNKISELSKYNRLIDEAKNEKTKIAIQEADEYSRIKSQEAIEARKAKKAEIGRKKTQNNNGTQNNNIEQENGTENNDDYTKKLCALFNVEDMNVELSQSSTRSLAEQILYSLGDHLYKTDAGDIFRQVFMEKIANPQNLNNQQLFDKIKKILHKSESIEEIFNKCNGEGLDISKTKKDLAIADYEYITMQHLVFIKIIELEDLLVQYIIRYDINKLDADNDFKLKIIQFLKKKDSHKKRYLDYNNTSTPKEAAEIVELVNDGKEIATIISSLETELKSIISDYPNNLIEKQYPHIIDNLRISYKEQPLSSEEIKTFQCNLRKSFMAYNKILYVMKTKLIKENVKLENGYRGKNQLKYTATLKILLKFREEILALSETTTAYNNFDRALLNIDISLDETLETIQKTIQIIDKYKTTLVLDPRKQAQINSLCKVLNNTSQKLQKFKQKHDVSEKITFYIEEKNFVLYQHITHIQCFNDDGTIKSDQKVDIEIQLDETKENIIKLLIENGIDKKYVEKIATNIIKNSDNIEIRRENPNSINGYDLLKKPKNTIPSSDENELDPVLLTNDRDISDDDTVTSKLKYQNEGLKNRSRSNSRGDDDTVTSKLKYQNEGPKNGRSRSNSRSGGEN